MLGYLNLKHGERLKNSKELYYVSANSPDFSYTTSMLDSIYFNNATTGTDNDATLRRFNPWGGRNEFKKTYPPLIRYGLQSFCSVMYPLFLVFRNL